MISVALCSIYPYYAVPNAEFRNWNVWLNIDILQKLPHCYESICHHLTWQPSAILISVYFLLTTVRTLIRNRVFSFYCSKTRFSILYNTPDNSTSPSILCLFCIPKNKYHFLTVIYAFISTQDTTRKSNNHTAARLS